VYFFAAKSKGVILCACVILCASDTAARSRQDSWASSAKKIRPLEKKLGRKPATPQIIRKSAVKKFFYKFLGQFLQIIVKIRLQLGNLELGRFLGRKKFYWAIFGSSGPEFGHLAPVASETISRSKIGDS
jgi:hypothetical protein